MDKNIVIFLLSFLTWMLLNWRLNPEHLVLGVSASLFVTYVLSDLFAQNAVLYKDPRRLFCFVFRYVPLFFISMIQAAMSVACRILHPDLPIRPGIVKVRTVLRTDAALTLLANAITLTAGTLTVDIDKENGLLYVHWVFVESQDIDTATRLIVGKFEPIIKSIFE